MLNSGLDIAFHMHAYQPRTQPQEIVDQIFRESYEPIIALTENSRKVSFSLDMTRSVGERLPPEFFERVIPLIKTGKIELINTPAEHYILPLVPPEVVTRQLQLNQQFYHDYFLTIGQSRGIFLPELAYSPQLPALFNSGEYRWCIADDGSPTYAWHHIPAPYRIPNTLIYEEASCGIFLRSREWSNRIANGNYCCGKHLLQELIWGNMQWRESKGYAGKSYIILAFDMETFGHWHKNAVENFLLSFFKEAERLSHSCSIVPIDRIFHEYPKHCSEKSIPAGSWSTSEDDFKKGIYYPLWNHPNNPYHRAWNEFKDLALATGYPSADPRLQELLDTAFYSCSPWWAAKPDPKDRKIAGWCFQMFKEIISHLAGHDAVPQLRYHLEEMKRTIK